MERKSVFYIILLLLLSIVLGGAQRAEAQDDAETARDQLFSLVMGQEIGSVMSNRCSLIPWARRRVMIWMRSDRKLQNVAIIALLI